IFADEDRVLLDVDDDVEIAGRAAVLPGLAFSRQLEPRPGIDARRNLHGEDAFVLYLAGSAAGGARVGDHLPRPCALVAGPRALEEALGEPQFARAVAGRTGPGARSGLGAGAVAGLAVAVARD